MLQPFLTVSDAPDALIDRAIDDCQERAAAPAGMSEAAQAKASGRALLTVIRPKTDGLPSRSSTSGTACPSGERQFCKSALPAK